MRPAVELVGDVARRKRQQQRRSELHQADQAEVEARR